MEKKILIVDDEPHLRLLIARALQDLEDEGVELLIANDGQEGLELIREQRPQLAFLDVMMPRKNGFEVCEIVKHDPALAEIYIILLTAKGQEVDIQRGEQVGANLYLTKPFDPDDLLARARSILGFD